MQPLKYLSEAKLAELRASIAEHLERYCSGGFLDLERDNGWAIEASHVKVDNQLLAQLSDTAGDIANSIVVYRALQGMTPAFATEERVWVRLTHVECLRYTRARWLRGVSEGRLQAAVLKHVFAKGRTGIRDDNAISRLWWNMHIASIADPDDPEGAVELLVKTADIRQAFVERPGTASRPPLARGIVRLMRRNASVAAKEGHFREFMKVLNREGGGVLFEVLSDKEVDRFMDACVMRAQLQ